MTLPRVTPATPSTRDSRGSALFAAESSSAGTSAGSTRAEQPSSRALPSAAHAVACAGAASGRARSVSMTCSLWPAQSMCLGGPANEKLSVDSPSRHMCLPGCWRRAITRAILRVSDPAKHTGIAHQWSDRAVAHSSWARFHLAVGHTKRVHRAAWLCSSALQTVAMLHARVKLFGMLRS